MLLFGKQSFSAQTTANEVAAGLPDFVWPAARGPSSGLLPRSGSKPAACLRQGLQSRQPRANDSIFRRKRFLAEWNNPDHA
jgi:hypothetical protein